MELVQTRRKNFKPISEELLESLHGSLVGVHWNAHEKCWSVLAFKSKRTEGTVIGHIPSLTLSDVSFKVNLSKKRNALEKGAKDRHTFIVGKIDFYSEYELEGYSLNNRFKYQPCDNVEPFKDLQGGSLVGSKAHFTSSGKVFKI